MSLNQVDASKKFYGFRAFNTLAMPSLRSYQATLIGALILCDLLKQICNYGMRYFSREQEYPFPQALLVAMLEIIKLAIVIYKTGGKCKVSPHLMDNLLLTLPTFCRP